MNRRTVLAVLLVVGLGAVFVREWMGSDGGARAPAEVPSVGPITIALAGDTLLHARPADDVRDPRTRPVFDLIAGATVAFANLEMQLLDEVQAQNVSGTTEPARWPFGRRREAEAIGALGFDLVSLANNHGHDYGAEGLASTRRLLAEAGVLGAGAGDDLVQARRPVFTPGSRRVALVAVTTSSSPVARATAAAPGVMGRPGISPLRYEADITVDPKTFAILAQSVRDLKAGPPPDDRSLELFGTRIAKGDRTAVAFRVDTLDEQEITEHIRAARAAAEVVVVSIHSHEPDNRTDEPADFVRAFAHRAIDAGASLVVGHGPHRVRGVEVYKDSAILYSLGNFLYQPVPDFRAADDFDAGRDLYSAALGALSPRPPTPTGMPADPAWREGAVALATFSGGRLSQLQIQPITLEGQGSELPGFPTISGEGGTLDRLDELSANWGTVFRRENGRGELVLP